MRHGSFPLALLVTALGASVLAPPVLAEPGPRADPDLGVLFVGAHPDDEASMLSTFGQWKQNYGVETGVVTITRGEGGGNAVGSEEGPSLGLLREGEERRAVAKAGISDVFNLDEADLYYTVSAPLTEQAWHHDDVLGKLVRVVRQTRPEVVVTMDPAPTPSNHGNHQYAARLALEAYRQAADPSAFPEQIGGEGLSPWAVRRVVGQSGGPEQELPGQECERRTAPPSATGPWYGIWAGRRAEGGQTWAQREVDAQREYASQGWAGVPDAPEEPAEIGCDHLTELANRAPHQPGAHGPDAVLRGAALPAPEGLPLGTQVTAVPAQSEAVPGHGVPVRVTVTAPRGKALAPGRVSFHAPPGWEVRGDGAFEALPPGSSAQVDFVTSSPATHEPGRVPLTASVRSGSGAGFVETRLDLVPPVVSEQEPLPGVDEFERWTSAAGFPLLAGSVPPVRTLPSGGTVEVTARVRNNDNAPRSGVVRFDPPRGFAVADPEQPFQDLRPGAVTEVRFVVRNTDTSIPTGMRGGDHRYTLTTDAGTTASTDAALELVPQTTIPKVAQAPAVDATAGRGEYPGSVLDLSSRWEGEECESRADCSATARVSWHGDALYAVVDVVDDRRGTRLAPQDCKRHWRTDAVEVAVDPAGISENTSSTFKLGVLPSTDDPAAGNPPCFARDADNHQGPGEETAPGVRVASKVRADGYTLELAIPLATLPGTVDPARMGLNLLVYDSDTQDKTGQTRIGWSTWGGVQGDPYRWGRAVIADLPAEEPSDPPPPKLPLDALSSVDSPASIAQAVRLGTSLGGAPPAGRAAAEVTAAESAPGVVRTRLEANGTGTVHLFVVDEAGKVLGERVVAVDGSGERWVPVEVGPGSARSVLAGFRSSDGATHASARPIQ